MKWLIKNIGLTLAGFLCLFGFMALEMRLQSIEDKMDQALKVEASIKVASVALPATAFGKR